MTSMSNKISKLKTNINTELTIEATRTMKVLDFLQHTAQVSYIITLKLIQMYVGIFSTITISLHARVAKG